MREGRVCLPPQFENTVHRDGDSMGGQELEAAGHIPSVAKKLGPIHTGAGLFSSLLFSLGLPLVKQCCLHLGCFPNSINLISLPQRHTRACLLGDSNFCQIGLKH